MGTVIIIMAKSGIYRERLQTGKEMQSSMRVIAGKAKRLPLKTVRGKGTRPTTDRIKETLFNMIQGKVPGCRFLDLFAGSGGIGIEALSRGAGKAVFVDREREAAACIRENLRFTKLEAQADVLQMDAVRAAGQLCQKGETFDLIFLDPPYDMGLEREVLEAISGTGLAGPDTLLIVEASLKTDFSWADQAGYTLLRKKEYKTNMHVFLKVKETEHEESGLPREL